MPAHPARDRRRPILVLVVALLPIALLTVQALGLVRFAPVLSGSMAGFVEALGVAAGVAEPLQMTVGVTDGERLYAARYATGPVVNSLYYSADMESLRQLYPVEERFAHFGPEARAVVSEPLVALPGLWHEVPAGSALTVEKGRVTHAPFVPLPPD